MSVRFANGGRGSLVAWCASARTSLVRRGAPRNASAQVVETSPHALSGPRPVGYFFLSTVGARPLPTAWGVSGPDLAVRRRRPHAPICTATKISLFNGLRRRAANPDCHG